MLTLILAAAAVLVIVVCAGLALATVARRVLPHRPPGMGTEDLRQFFNCPDNFEHRSAEQISAQTRPFQHDRSLDWGIYEYRWERHRLYVVVDTRDHVVTRVRMSADPLQPQTLAVVCDGSDVPAGGPA